MYNLSSWQFDEKVSNIFDTHVRQSVPGYDDIQQLVCSLSDYFVKHKGIIYDLGCSTGETIYLINNRHKNKQLQFVGIDNSQAMLNVAKVKNKENTNVTFINANIEDYDFDIKANLIISILSIQFVSISQRETLINRIYDSLDEGGAFIFVEKTFAKHSKSQDIFTQLYYDFKEINNLSSKEIRDKEKSLRGVLCPLSVEENIKLLESVGFKVDVFYKNLNFIGFFAMK